jgi:hypothetical protein
MDRPGEVAKDVEPSGRAWAWVALTVAFYLALTAWLSWELNVWRDEMYSLHTSAGSVGYAVRRAIDFELQPPVYFGLLAAWRTFNDSIFFARLLSSLLGAGTIVVAAVLARRFAPRVEPVYAAALFATHPFLVWAGTEIRVYALVIFLSALLCWTFVEAYWFEAPRPRARLAFAAVALVAMYTQYYLALLLVGFGTALVVRRERSRLLAFVLDAGLVGVLSVPLLLAIRAQLHTHQADLGRRPPLGVETIRLVVGRFEAYLFSFNDAIDKSNWALSTVRAARWAYRALIVAAVGMGVWYARRRSVADQRPPAHRWGTPAVVAGIVAYAVCMATLFVVVGPKIVGERHTAGLLFPAILAAMALPATVIGRQAVQAWTGLLLASNVAATTLVHAVPLAKDCDCRHVAEAITQRETSREPILVFPSEDALPLGVYYRGRNRLLPVPGAVTYDSWDQSTFVIRSPDDVARILEAEAPGAVGLWVHTNTYGPNWGPEKLEAFLAGAYRQDAKYAFERGVILRHFVPRGVGTGSTSVASP